MRNASLALLLLLLAAPALAEPLTNVDYAAVRHWCTVNGATNPANDSLMLQQISGGYTLPGWDLPFPPPSQAWLNTASNRTAAAVALADRQREARFDESEIVKAVAAELVTMCNSNRAVIRKAANLTPAKFPDVTAAQFKAAVKARLP